MLMRMGHYTRASMHVPDRACNPTLPEPNMSLNLEIADMINAKKANAWVADGGRWMQPGSPRAFC